MKKGCFVFLFVLFLAVVHAQSLVQSLQKACTQFQADPQLRHGILSLYIVDAKTGTRIFALNNETGLAPASCQKLFTSVAAFELLGHDFRYKTRFAYDGQITDGTLSGNLYVVASGDPSFGSWRWNQTKPESIFNQVVSAIKQAGIHRIAGRLYVEEAGFSLQPLPGGWIWDDIGNYYGAGTWALNWNENQYDLILKPGKKPGDSVGIGGMSPPIALHEFVNQVSTAEKGSGDNSYIYLPPYADFGFAMGTIPAGDSAFTISGSIPNPPLYFARALETAIRSAGISLDSGQRNGPLAVQKIVNQESTLKLTEWISPSLDSLNYWFLKKSINLYGEALLKTMALEKEGFGSTEKGVDVLKAFWVRKGIEASAINVLDGSGLSPQNRVTTKALVRVLQYAQDQTWFPSFFEALPEINGIKMKGGSIGGARSFAGYQESKGKRKYIFAIIVNNYDGSSALIVQKMKHLLDLLK